MASENKIQEYMDNLEQQKIMIETHFANMERILRDSSKLDKEKVFALLSNFNTLNIQYEQLCNDLIVFIQIIPDFNTSGRTCSGIFSYNFPIS